MNTGIVAILQARISSSRLPGKVLRPLIGKPMLARQIERVQRSEYCQKLIVATSTDSSDDAIVDLCSSLKIQCFRGSLDDVLDRFYRAALLYSPQHVVRLTGDCPLADPRVIDLVVKFHLDGDFDYTSNALKPTYPDGLDVEVCKFAPLEVAWRQARSISQREHVMPFIHQQPDIFKLGSVEHVIDLSSLRWTVDEPSDFQLMEIIFNHFLPAEPAFTTEDVLNFLDSQPDLKNFNTQHARNEGYARSLTDDKP